MPPQVVGGEKGKNMTFSQKINKKIILPIINGTKQPFLIRNFHFYTKKESRYRGVKFTHDSGIKLLL